jgi:hypothetical protein
LYRILRLRLLMLLMEANGMLLGMLMLRYEPKRTVTVVQKEHDVHNIHAQFLMILQLLELVQLQLIDAQLELHLVRLPQVQVSYLTL